MHDLERPNLHTDIEPDVYENMNEVVWKNVVLNAYLGINEILEAGDLNNDPEIVKLQNLVISLFNSNHSQEIFCSRIESIISRAGNYLTDLGKKEINEFIGKKTDEVRTQIGEFSSTFKVAKLPNTQFLQTYIEDGKIEIANKPLYEFAEQNDFFKATLQLFMENDNSYRSIIESSFRKGFQLSNDEKRLVVRAQRNSWNSVDLITSLLLHQQITKNFDTLQNYELLPDSDGDTNSNRKQQALEEAYYLMGKITSTVALFCKENSINFQIKDEEIIDPVALFINATGKELSKKQLTAIRKIALAHSSHGLNSGELTAQLAGSVRTTFPRALIASFNIRSGMLHAGAITECMRQTREFLESDQEAESFIKNLLVKGEKFYGFGHRIHKTNLSDPEIIIGKDPRVQFYIDACIDGFPEKIDEINKLLKYATVIRRLRPNLGANSDFGASVLFHSLNLSSNVAEGFFSVFRTPGLCARVVNELNIKGNSRRPPFPPVLPYQLP